MSTPDPKYFKDGAGLRIRHWPYLRAFGLRKWFWFAQPRWLLIYRCRRNDRRA